MKLIALQAFGGLLSSQTYIPVQEYPRDYRVPYHRAEQGNWKFSTPTDLSTMDDPLIFRQARFVPTGKFIVLENKNTAMIYELEQM